MLTKFKRSSFAAGVAAAALLLAACGSGGSGEKKAADGSAVDEAAKLIAPFLQRPTEPEVTAPIAKPVPAGKKIDFITCASPGCALIASQFKEAASVLDWQVKVLTTSAAAEEINAAYNTAIRDEPDAVAVVTVSTDVVKRQLDQLKTMNIPVVTAQDPAVAFGPIIAALYTQTSFDNTGKTAADYLISKDCTKGTTIFVLFDGYLTLQKRHEAFKAEYKRLAPDAKLTTVSLGAGTDDIMATMVGAIRKDGDVSCVYLSVDAIGTGFPQAIKAAGLELPFIMTDYGTDTTLQYVKDGLMGATLVADPGSYAYIFADTLARHFAGESVDPDTSALQNVWIVDKNTAPATFPTSNVEDLKSKYAAIWGKG